MEVGIWISVIVLVYAVWVWVRKVREEDEPTT
jgi:hypothetical protein